MLKVLERSVLDQCLARGHTETFYTELLVTPDMAATLLDANPGNRPMRPRAVQSYVEAMNAGEWRVNGQNIIVSSDGLLNDGQHRLAAVVLHAKPVKMGFMFGVPRETRDTCDLGAKKTPGNILAMDGEKNTNSLAVALRAFVIMDGNLSYKAEVRVAQLQETLAEHPHIRDALRYVDQLGSEFRISRGWLAAAYYRCAQVSEDDAELVVTMTRSGIGFKHGSDPIYRLRGRFLDHRSGKNRITGEEQAALFTKAFNYSRGTRRVTQLKWRSDEPFPVPC